MESKWTSLQMDWGWALVVLLSLSAECGLHAVHMWAVTLPTSREDRMTCCGQGLAHRKEGATPTAWGGHICRGFPKKVACERWLGIRLVGKGTELPRGGPIVCQELLVRGGMPRPRPERSLVFLDRGHCESRDRTEDADAEVSRDGLSQTLSQGFEVGHLLPLPHILLIRLLLPFSQAQPSWPWSHEHKKCWAH